MRFLDKIVDIVNRFPVVNYYIHKLLSRDKRAYKNAIEKLIPIEDMNNKTILDLGSGTGHFSKYFPESTKLISSDINFLNCKFAKSRTNKFIVNLDGTKMLFGSNPIDLIVCVDVFHHLNDAMVKNIIHEAYRVLNKEGKFILVDIFIPRRKGFLSWFVVYVERGKYIKQLELRQIAGHKNLFLKERDYR